MSAENGDVLATVTHHVYVKGKWRYTYYTCNVMSAESGDVLATVTYHVYVRGNWRYTYYTCNVMSAEWWRVGHSDASRIRKG